MNPEDVALGGQAEPATVLTEPELPASVVVAQGTGDLRVEVPAPAPDLATPGTKEARPSAELSEIEPEPLPVVSEASTSVPEASTSVPEATAAIFERVEEPVREDALAAPADDSRYQLRLGSETRQRAQTESRERRRRIERLASDLTRAAHAGDESESERLLRAMEGIAGGNSSYVLNMRAYVELLRGEYTAVETLLAVVLARDETDVDAGLNMAIAESRTGRLSQARERLARLVLEHPEDDRVDTLLRSLEGR
jgi:hypothetical protein